MQPGFNHNIRYKDKVFHVQTEDNGIDDPDLVTQVFLAGQIIAIERSTYSEILVDGLDDRARDLQIRMRMQDQHKRLLRNLVVGNYDAKIASFAKPNDTAPASPAEVLERAAESLPEPSPDLASVATLPAGTSLEPRAPEPVILRTTLDVETPILLRTPVLTTDSLLVPEADLGQNGAPRGSASAAPRSLIDDLRMAQNEFGPIDTTGLDVDPDRVLTDDDLLAVIEEEMQRQLPWTPSTEAVAQAPTPFDPLDPVDSLDHIEPLDQMQPSDLRATPIELQMPAPIAALPEARPIEQGTPSERPTEPPFDRVPMRDSSKSRIIRETYRPAGSEDPVTQRIRASSDERRIPPDAAETKISRRPPSNPPSSPLRNKPPPTSSDTLVDFHIPASLRREIDEEIARRATVSDGDETVDEKNGPWRIREVDGRADPDSALKRPGSSMAPKPDGRYIRTGLRSERPFEPETEVDLNLRRALEAEIRDTQQQRAVQEHDTIRPPSQAPPPIERPPTRPPSMRGQTPSEMETPIPDRPPSRGPSTGRGNPVLSRPPSKAPVTQPPLPPPVAVPPPSITQRDPVPRSTSNSSEVPQRSASGSLRNPLDQHAKTITDTPRESISKPDEKRPSILVVERSLDEVILSYLYDEMSEK